jgi:hypothetical protein
VARDDHGSHPERDDREDSRLLEQVGDVFAREKVRRGERQRDAEGEQYRGREDDLQLLERPSRGALEGGA